QLRDSMNETPVDYVGVDSTVARPQLQGGGRLSPLGETVQAGQFVDPAGPAQLGEQAAAAHGLKLAGITDARQSPPLAVGEVNEAVQGGGAEHAGLVHDDRRADGEPILIEWSPVGSAPFVEQL